MTNEIKKAIEELEQVRLELFRCAAQLDAELIETEMMIENYSADPKYANMLVRVRKARRNAMIKVSEWSKLKEREEAAWQKLFDSIDSN